ncbi:type IV pilin protein [Pseudomonas gingeri]|uniref:Type IV pilin protein n=1 Tax=Pseudomonas gingeri TaxID=117681 RepID=A0A7Y7XDB5_9PSED|nr:type IV pilin protein [Pseudomonas gingeri]NWB97814.1 type IV pilin protein [Pseudomonas gingeri]
MRRTSSGFTLIELMIAVVVVGILAAVAYPNYLSYVKKTHRYEIAELISEQAQTLERFYTRNATYVGVTGLSAGNSYYNITSTLAATTFTLTATPSTGSMMVGDMCGNYTLDNTGARANPGSVGATTKDCWGR